MRTADSPAKARNESWSVVVQGLIIMKDNAKQHTVYYIAQGIGLSWLSIVSEAIPAKAVYVL